MIRGKSACVSEHLIQRSRYKDLTSVASVQAENFDTKYLEINPAGTVPSLTAPSLPNPLTDTQDILLFLDRAKGPPEEHGLFPKDSSRRDLVQKLIEHIHSDSMSTNIILFMARDAKELELNKSSGWDTFLSNRQSSLENHQTEHPDNAFYGRKVVENGATHQFYKTKDDQKLESFFRESQTAYMGLIRMLEELDNTLVLPYAAGKDFSAADIHMAPWFSHALMGVHAQDIRDLDKLEAHLQRSVADFKIGHKTRSWWSNMNSRASFKEFYPKPH